jgi:hypothetical protein
LRVGCRSLRYTSRYEDAVCATGKSRKNYETKHDISGDLDISTRRTVKQVAHELSDLYAAISFLI